MARENSREGATSRQGSTDGSALPATAGWANTPVARARRASQAASTSTASPQLTHAIMSQKKIDSQTKPETAQPITTTAQQPKVQQVEATTSPVPDPPSKSPDPVEQKQTPASAYDEILQNLVSVVTNNPFTFHFDDSCLSPETRAAVAALPPLFDPYGGAKRRLMQDKQAAYRARLEAEEKQRMEDQATSAAEDALEEDSLGGAGSLALGGEPEEDPRSASARGTIGRPPQPLSASGIPLDQLSNVASRSLTPQQRQQMVMHNAASAQPPRPPQQLNAAAFDLSDFDRRMPTYSQAQYDQMSSHARHGSRYFNNDSKTNSSRFPSQQPSQQPFFSSGVQGPPPGLPTAGTPPVSGGGMFAHGQGFTSGFGAAKDSDSMRARSGTNVGHDVKRELLLSLQNSSNPLRSPPVQASAPSVLNGIHGQLSSGYVDRDLIKPRTKKGSKKQRHANTSSSGGGVEHLAADPSILSARLHQGAGGQGLFTSNQGGYTQSNMAQYGGNYNRW